MNVRAALTCFLALLLALPALAAPTKLAQQGRVLDGEGDPLEGSHSMFFALYDADIDGAELWSEERSVDFEAGYYSVMLGEEVPLDDLLFDVESVWLEVTIDGETLAPRQEVVSVPYALRATAAEHLEGGVVDAGEIAVDGTVVIDASGNWVGPPPAVGWGDISDVPGDIADGDQDTDTLAGLSCGEGQLPKWDASSSLWICADDIDTDTTVPDTDTLLTLVCTSGQVAKWDGSTWDCADDIDTTVPNTDTLLTLVCTSGQVAKWDGSTWDCADDIDTTVPNTDVLAGLSCGEGQLPKWDDTSSLWICADDIDTTVPDTDTLLTLVCTSGQVAKWDGSTWDCADDIDTTVPNTDVLAGLSCGEGQLPKWDDTSSLWICADDTDTTVPNTDTLLTLVCTSGQVAKWDGSAWGCGDDTDTTVPNTDVLAGLSCDEGQLPKWDASSSLWVCGDDLDTVTSSLAWTAITGVPAELADGDQDSQLTEAEVDAYASNNGYLQPDSDGNVGIGTATPTEKLTVVGVIESTSGGVKFPDGTTQSTAVTPLAIPAGMVAFFAAACPSGWTAYASAEGRLLVGVPSGGTLEGTVGSPLGDLADRTITEVPSHAHTGAEHTHSGAVHTHGFSATTNTTGAHSHSNGGSYHPVQAGCCESGWQSASTGVAGDHSHTVSGTTDSAGSGETGSATPGLGGTTGVASVDVTMPYLQLQACMKD